MAPLGRHDQATTSHRAGRRLRVRGREADERRVAVEMADLEPAAPPVRTQLEREATAHRGAVGNVVVDRQTREIERQIEPDAGAVEVDEDRVEDSIDEVGELAHDEASLHREGTERRELGLGQAPAIDDEPSLPERAGLADLVRPDRELLADATELRIER